MADTAAIIDGPARDWLAARRAELNDRFRAARRRFPQLTPEPVLSLCRELLPGLARNGEAGTAELLSNVFGLILLHAGRGTLASGGGGSPAIAVLLRETFPRLRPLLLARPADLPAAISNAVENLGGRGVELARGFADLADQATTPDELLDAGAVLAWRLGEARLRTRALQIAARLSTGAARRALGLTDWADDALPRAIAALAADGWRLPGASKPAAKPRWELVGRVGNFRGFDGHFDQPPQLLDAGSVGTRHRFWVKSGTTTFRLDADVFGWVCRPDPSADYPAREAKGKKKPAGLPAGATTFIEVDGVLAYTRADSFRVRVLAPPGEPS